MKFVISEMSFANSLYGAVFIELAFTPMKHGTGRKIYVSCDTDPVNTGEILFTRLTNFSMLSLLQKIEDMEEKIAEMETLSQDYSEEYDCLCAEVEACKKTFDQSQAVNTKYRAISNMMENIAKAGTYYGKIIDIEVEDSDIIKT